MVLTIITINYNNAEGLRKTLASVASQTYPHIEHIIIDGGSSDNSVEVIRGYESSLSNRLSPLASRLKWLSEKDTGIYNAMNKGIRMATGDYIQILNSGDMLAAPDVTERMMAALLEIKGYRLEVKGSENGEADTPASRLSPLASRLKDCPAIFYGNMIKEYPDGRRVKDTCGGGDHTPESFLYFYRGTLNHDCAYIRRDLFEKYGLYNEQMKICSDWEWYVRAIVLGGEKTSYTDIDVTVFDMMGVSESGGKNRALIQQERRTYLESILPVAVLRDYDKYAFPIEQYQRLKKYRLWGLVFFVERVLFKLEKWRMLK